MTQWKLLIPYIKVTVFVAMFYLGIWMACLMALHFHWTHIVTLTKNICNEHGMYRDE